MHEIRAFFSALNRCVVCFGVLAAIVLFSFPLFSAEVQQDGTVQSGAVSGGSVLLKSQNEAQQAVWEPSGMDSPPPSLVLPPERVLDSVPIRSPAKVSANAEQSETDGKGRSARVSRKKQVRDSLRVAALKRAEVLKQMKRAAEKKVLDSLETAARTLRIQDSLRRESAMVRYRDSVRLVLAHERTLDSLNAIRMKRNRSSVTNRSARKKQYSDSLKTASAIAGGDREKPKMELVDSQPLPGRLPADSVLLKSGPGRPVSGQPALQSLQLKPVPQQKTVSTAGSRSDSLSAAALLYYRQGSYDRALPVANQALFLSRKRSGLNSSTELPSLVLIADIYLAEKKYRQAMPFYLRALAISEKMPAQDYSVTAGILYSLGLLHAADGSESRADEYYRKALAL
ncbi:MAG: tetratricopeptide repeat protein, partial [Chlorobium limicola]|uniref:tetratricopeptide repeat protein n=1 Tax=Chlorobium limicola TaxID=1092 RepID=UPI0023F4EEF4